MFVFFLIKTVLIILTYFTLIVSLLVLRQYIKQFFSYLKGGRVEEELPNLKHKAKAIVVASNLSLMVFSIWMIQKTAAWQMVLAESMKNAASAQPVFLIMLAFLVLYPIIALRKWAIKSE